MPFLPFLPACLLSCALCRAHAVLTRAFRGGCWRCAAVLRVLFRVLSDLYFKWARTVDPLLYENPIWWQCIEWMNLCFLMPFSILALWAFARGMRRCYTTAADLRVCMSRLELDPDAGDHHAVVDVLLPRRLHGIHHLGYAHFPFERMLLDPASLVGSG